MCSSDLAGSFTTGLAVVAYLLGCTVMALVLMFAYGVSSAPRGSYGDALAIAVLAGVLHFAVLKLSRCRENVVIWVTLAMAPLAVIGGHVVGYGEAQDFAWRYVHDIAPQNFSEPEWRNLSHRENFRRDRKSTRLNSSHT